MAIRTGKISFCDMLARCDAEFKEFFDMSLLPQLVEKKIVPKGLQKTIAALGPKRAPAILISGLKQTTSENFVQLLGILEVHARQDMRSRKLMGILSSHIKDMAIPGGEDSEAAAIVHNFLDMVKKYYPEESPTATTETEEGKEGVTIETDTEQGGDVCLASPPPPPGYMEGCVSDYFGQEGGVLYSPIHGIRIEIPPNSLPQHVARCFLGIYVYARGPFTLPDGVESYSPVVWVNLQPHFTFEKDVTLTIPHSASLSMDAELCVYRMAADMEDKRNPPYHLSEKVPGSECDWYHARARVRHFSPYEVGAEKKVKKEPIFRHSYWITRCMPKDRSCTPWEAKFYVVQRHPTALWEVIQAGVDCECSSPANFYFTDDRLHFSCREVSKGWDVYPTELNEIFIADLSWSDNVSLKAHPHSLTYHIGIDESEVPSPIPPLKCTIDIKGAHRGLTYTLTSTLPKKQGHTSTSLFLTTPCYLYDKGSAVVQHLSSGDIESLYLDTKHDEHVRLITDISLQLPSPAEVAQLLNIDYEKMAFRSPHFAEQNFHLLWSWVCKSSVQGRKLTLHDLCDILKVKKIMLSQPEANDCPYAQSEYMERVDLKDHNFVYLVYSLQACWKFVGRFLGIREECLTAIIEDTSEPRESRWLAYEMIRKWHSIKTMEANYRTLFRAVHRLWEFDFLRADCHHAFCLTLIYIVPSTCLEKSEN